MKRTFKTIIFCITILFTTQTWAGMIFFFKGDAHFSIDLNKQLVKQLKKRSKRMTLYYHRMTTAKMFCGIHGHKRISLMKLPYKVNRNLRRVYKHLSHRRLKRYPKGYPGLRSTGVQGFITLVYNKKAPVNSNLLGYGYNKQLVKEYLPSKMRGHRGLEPRFYKDLKRVYRRRLQNGACCSVFKYSHKTMRAAFKKHKVPALPIASIRISKKERRLAVYGKKLAFFVLEAMEVKELGIKEAKTKKRGTLYKEGLILYRVTRAIEKYRFTKGKWKRVRWGL